MGEARRRRLAGDRVEYIDLVSGEKRFARNAGDPVAFLIGMAQRAAAFAARRPVPDAKVKCDGCTACCYYHRVDVHPEYDDLKHLDTEQDDNGKLVLKKRDDGACVHLGENGCTVYDHRPLACRTYDCRAAALVSMSDTFDEGRHPPVWLFRPTSHHGRVLQECFRMLGIMFQMRAEKTKEPNSVHDALRFAMERIEELYTIVDGLSRMSPEQACRALGLESIPTPEEHRALALKVLVGIKMAS